MIKVLTACLVLLVMAMHVSTQVTTQTNTTQAATTTTTTTINSGTNGTKSGGLVVMPSILSVVLPVGLLVSLLQRLRC